MTHSSMLALTYEIRPIRWLPCKLAGRFWRRAYTSWLSGLRLQRVPVPRIPGPGWVRLKTVLGGICGTDLALITQRNHPATFLRSLTSYPMLLGHENVAVVEEAGPEVQGFTPGMRVCVEPTLSCVPRGVAPLCSFCEKGTASLCINTTRGALPPGTMIGANSFTGGSWAPHFVAHESQLHPIPDGVSDETAVLIDPVSSALHGVLRRPPLEGERVLVIGGGVIALATVACLRTLCPTANITAIARHEYQAGLLMRAGASECIITPRAMSSADRYGEVARRVGGEVIPGKFGNYFLIGGYDVTYDCIGTGQSLTDAVKFTRSRGTVVELGTSQITVVDTTPVWFSELTLIGGYGRQIESVDDRRIHTYDLLLEWLVAGRIDIEPWLTHTFAPSDYRRAFETLCSPGRGRIVKAAFKH